MEIFKGDPAVEPSSLEDKLTSEKSIFFVDFNYVLYVKSVADFDFFFIFCGWWDKELIVTKRLNKSFAFSLVRSVQTITPSVAPVDKKLINIPRLQDDGDISQTFIYFCLSAMIEIYCFQSDMELENVICHDLRTLL